MQPEMRLQAAVEEFHQQPIKLRKAWVVTLIDSAFETFVSCNGFERIQIAQNYVLLLDFFDK
jgi:hypothetical protein